MLEPCCCGSGARTQNAECLFTTGSNRGNTEIPGTGGHPVRTGLAPQKTRRKIAASTQSPTMSAQGTSKPASTPSQPPPKAPVKMIEVVVNDRLGKKVRVKCRCVYNSCHSDLTIMLLLLCVVAFCVSFLPLCSAMPLRRCRSLPEPIFPHHFSMQPKGYDWRFEENYCSADWYEAREIAAAEVVQCLQGCHHFGRLRNS